MNFTRKSSFLAAGTLLCGMTALATNPLAPGETLLEPFADEAEVKYLDDAARTGGSLEVDGRRWVFTDTSSDGSSAGSHFVIAYEADSKLVAAINEVLARPVDSEPTDFLFTGQVERTASSSRLIGVDMRASLGGRDRPRAPIFERTLYFGLEPQYLTSRHAQQLTDLTSRARFRIWPSGGKESIDRVALDLWVRVEHHATPESIAISDLTVSEIGKAGGITDTATAKTVLCVEGMPPAAFIGAWREKGWHVRVGLDATEGEEVAAIYANSLSMNDATASRIVEYADQGATLFLGLGEMTGDVAKPLLPILPINDWPFHTGLRRTSCVGQMRDGSPAPTFSYRFDMHLPGAPIESSLFRYLPEAYLRNKTRFPRTAVVMACRDDAILPMLVDADVEKSRIIFLAASFEDPSALVSSAYEEWARSVALLPFKPGAPDQTPAVEAPTAWAMREARAPYSIAIEEDESTLSELSPSPFPREGIDGLISYRYIYHAGTTPRLKLRVRNHFANIAPLATASDLGWPENETTAGLNDSAYTYANVRGTLPIHAVWTGRTAPEQRLRLAWKEPATVAGMRLTSGGKHRFWERNQPHDFALSAADGTALYATTGAEYAQTPAIERASWEAVFPEAKMAGRAVELHITNLDPEARREPNRGFPSNCALVEWELWGWLGAMPQDALLRQPELEIIAESLSDGKRTSEKRPLAPLRACSETTLDVALPVPTKYGPVRYHFVLSDRGEMLAENTFDIFVANPKGTKILPTTGEDWAQGGFLCSPGWRSANDFGLGMRKWSAGWGGPHDKFWAYEQDLLETGSRSRPAADRMLTSSTRASHYTNPWRKFLNGTYSWDWVAEKYLGRLQRGDRFRKDSKGFLFSLEDRWNGIPVGHCFGWDTYVDFDHWLQAQGKPGLRGRTLNDLNHEITEEHGDEWQRFNLERYADKLLATQRLFKEAGYEMNTRTHGSFPVCGGELGAKLAKTDIGVGTDLFWELRRQDLFWSIASRIGVVAANPNLQSGAYDEWGWVNSDQNRWWYGASGDIATARRQWYATYFLGRVDISGTYQPYHVNGYSGQGYHGVRYTARDHEARTRTHQLVTHVRPEQAAGYGLVVSWRGQERRMGKAAGTMGFGLFTAQGEDDVVDLCGQAWSPLMKQGLPLSFVTSTDAIAKWQGNAPLVLVDAFNWEDWELEAAEAARQRGATLVVIGEPHPTLANPKAAERFTNTIKPKDGVGGLVVLRKAPKNLTSRDAAAYVQRINEVTGNPLRISAGMAVIPFVSNDTLFLSLCREGDDSGDVRVSICPEFFHAASADCGRVVSLDDGTALKVTRDSTGALQFTVPMEPTSSRVVMITK